jgi:hypothetical protein
MDLKAEALYNIKFVATYIVDGNIGFDLFQGVNPTQTLTSHDRYNFFKIYVFEDRRIIVSFAKSGKVTWKLS